MARHLAATIGYRYIDSGAMYRAVTLYALRNGWASPAGVDTASLTAALPDIDIDFLPQPDGTQHTLLNGEDVEALIRGIEVSEAVSPVAAVPEVRHALVAMQQRLGAGGGIVMDGRDIGTTVFPNAELKVYVDASAETRARRRYDEMTAKGIDVDYDEILANVRNRDHIDTTRSESPLRKADDAVLLDNSDMTPEQQNARLLELYNQAIQQSRAKNRD